MLTVYRVFKKELSGYFNSPSAYIFLIIFTILAPSLFFFLTPFFRAKTASLVNFFWYLPFVFLFFIPAISMRIWAEEKKGGTEELLMTLPLRDWEVVLGKYFAALFLLLVALLLTFPVPVTVWHFADPSTAPDTGPLICGYLASFLVGAGFLALGTWCSSMTVNQIIAFITSCTSCFVLVLLGFPNVTAPLPGWLGDTINYLSPWSHFTNMYRGMIEATNIAYFFSFVVLFLFLNTRSIESRKWK